MRRLGGSQGQSQLRALLRGLKRCQCECEAASVDLLLLPPVEMGKWICKSSLSGEGASLDLLAAAYQQRVLWAEAHADSRLPANHSNDGGVFGPSSKSAPRHMRMPNI